jgi:two-component system CheB/CheR fusion protein
MEEVGANGFESYHAFLQAHPEEFAALLNALLLNFTSFFREADAWEGLRERAIPYIVDRPYEDGSNEIRIWSAGCASGEEPYSLAMLFAEALGMDAFLRRVRIYATDLDDEALSVARRAAYSPEEVQEVPPVLLAKYFTARGDKYVLNPELRRSIVFGRHDVVRHAPIGRVALLVCRNVLTHLDDEVGLQVLPRMHFALRDDGLMFVGMAEAQLDRSPLFQSLDVEHRIFRKVPRGRRRSGGGSLGFAAGSPPAGSLSASPFHMHVLEAIADSTAHAYLAIDADDKLVFANTAARRMLGVAEDDLGNPFQDLPVSYRPAELRSWVEEAAQSGRTMRFEHQDYHPPAADPIRVTIEVKPMIGRHGRQFGTLLGFIDTSRSYRLQQELEAVQISLETTVGELQSANEELEMANEELQTANEELGGANEALQSANQELEMTNEELRSANDELQRRQAEFAEYRRRDDAVLSSIDRGIVVLSQDLRVQSWNRWNEVTWGVPAERAVGQFLEDVDFGLPAEPLRRELQRVLAEGLPHADIVLEAVGQPDRRFSCRVRIALLSAGNQSSDGLVLLLEEITGLHH